MNQGPAAGNGNPWVLVELKSGIAIGMAAGVAALAAVALMVLLRNDSPGGPDKTPSSPRAGSGVAPAPVGEEVPAEALRRSIELAAAYLNEHIDPNGRFEYRIDALGQPAEPRYNVLRHAGSIYGLGMYFDRSGDEATALTIRLATGYLRERHLQKLEDQPGGYVIFSLPGEEAGEVREVKLGGCALALVAFLRAREIERDIVTMEALRGLARFILSMQRPDGSFHSKWSEKQGFLTGFESLYYPGEAILGLTLLYQVDPDERWLRGAAEAAAYLVESRRGQELDLPSDHWLMIAASHLLPVYGALADPPISAEEIRLHAIRLGLRMMQEQEDAARVLDALGAFVVDERSSPTATRLEGLVALHGLLREDETALRASIERSIAAGSAWLLRCQVPEGPGQGGFLRTREQIPGWGESFNRRQTEIRIDYVQHALSALIGALEIREPAASTIWERPPNGL